MAVAPRKVSKTYKASRRFSSWRRRIATSALASNPRLWPAIRLDQDDSDNLSSRLLGLLGRLGRTGAEEGRVEFRQLGGHAQVRKGGPDRQPADAHPLRSGDGHCRDGRDGYRLRSRATLALYTDTPISTITSDFASARRTESLTASFFLGLPRTLQVPRRPYESARLDAELKLAGEYGLKNKKEIWRIALVLSKIRRAARELLKLDEKDPKRLFEGNALIRRLIRIGVLDETRMRLDYVLALKIEDFLERRLQTQVFKSGLAKSIHHARVLIRQRHIRVGKQIVNVPSFVVRLDSQKHIDFSLTSPYGGARAGRVKRKRAAAAAAKANEGGDDEAAEDSE
ncbi:hypothetical protein BMF94_3903 [Rhodotorula taiwanensis]|uniref:Uncharacterized protein n=1 Tax=Rhodotorula taiwanensis TaxID=741276 RepID=A0A2S5B8H4_9BASI|nr:hypothetical protein BMF94_3903 [Rhodotorula taiwanensis]